MRSLCRTFRQQSLRDVSLLYNTLRSLTEKRDYKPPCYVLQAHSLKPSSLEGGLPTPVFQREPLRRESCCLLLLPISRGIIHLQNCFSVNEFDGKTKPGNKWPSKTVHFQSSDLAAFCLWAVLTYSCQESNESVRL